MGNAFKLSFACVVCFQPELNILIGDWASENEWLSIHTSNRNELDVFHIDQSQGASVTIWPHSPAG
jgi:hypothetical protein